MYPEKIVIETLWTWFFVVTSFLTYFVVWLFLSRKTYACVKNIIEKFNLDWLIKGLAYALILALIPGSSWCLENGLQNRYYELYRLENFLDLPLSIRIPIYILLGVVIQFLCSLKNK